MLLLVSGYESDAGRRPSARAMPITARTKLEISVSGRRLIANTGASIGANIRNIASAIAPLPDNGSVIAGGARRRRLQRWTRQYRVRQLFRALIAWCRQTPGSLQRWTRQLWKSLCFQSHTRERGRVCKRRLDSGGGGQAVTLPIWRPGTSILTYIGWSYASLTPASFEPRG